MGWNVYAFDAIFSFSYTIIYICKTQNLVSHNDHDKNSDI